MSAGDDDHDDDAQLKQLRAVWVSMREEDPPDRGLAALMSAAREKAAELEQAARPSWWQSVLATLRKPQVLALATVTILLGGALIVTQRTANKQAEQSVLATDEASRAKGAYDDEAVTGDSRITGVGAPAAGSASAATVDNFEHDATKSAEVVTEVPPRDAKPTAKPTPKAATKSRPPVTARPPEEPKLQKEPVTDPGDAVQAGPRGAGAAPSLSIAQDDAPEAAPVTRDESATVKSPPKKPIARTPPPTIEGEDRLGDKDGAKTQPTLDQLVKQCETAAARGDCAAVRVIAKKIQATSPTAYKSRVTNNASINRCLAPE